MLLQARDAGGEVRADLLREMGETEFTDYVLSEPLDGEIRTMPLGVEQALAQRAEIKRRGLIPTLQVEQVLLWRRLKCHIRHPIEQAPLQANRQALFYWCLLHDGPL